MKEGWSRDVLLNFMDAGLYEREGKALTTSHEPCRMRQATLRKS